MSLEELTSQNTISLLQRAGDFFRRNLFAGGVYVSLALIPLSCNSEAEEDESTVVETGDLKASSALAGPSNCNNIQLCHMNRSTIVVSQSMANIHLSHGDYLGRCQPDSDGDGYSSRQGDCDDTNNAINPAAPELCDGVDNNCDGLIDDGVLSTFYADNDGDGIGNLGESIQACTAIQGYVADMIMCNYNDCDDTNAALWQSLAAYVDNDSDGFGAGNIVMVCSGASLPSGYTLNNVDCDDNTAAIHPGAFELCDYTDNNCRDGADEHFNLNEICSAGVGECTTTGATVCSETGLDIICSAVAGEPVAEVCNSLDNDCDGVINNGLATLIMLDDFNRPSGSLGHNLLGNAWTNYGTLGDWTIDSGGYASTSWTGSGGYNPIATSDIGYRETFDIVVRFKLLEVSNVGNSGAFIYGVNSSVSPLEGGFDGFGAHIAMGGASTHALRKDSAYIASGNQTISANTDYLMRFSFDGSILGLKLWAEGNAEPANNLISVSTTNTNPAKSYMTMSGDMDGGEHGGTTIDYIIMNGCQP